MDTIHTHNSIYMTASRSGILIKNFELLQCVQKVESSFEMSDKCTSGGLSNQDQPSEDKDKHTNNDAHEDETVLSREKHMEYKSKKKHRRESSEESVLRKRRKKRSRSLSNSASDYSLSESDYRKRRKKSSSRKDKKSKTKKKKSRDNKRKKHKKEKKHYSSSSSESSNDNNVRRSVISGKKIKMHIHKTEEDLTRDKARREMLKFMNSSF